ncbi:MAG TPA: hypothetical protein DHV62_05605, partial [Elusimicrobia bacterium]|nr:hypothetical protein [Elusimicrobiota bacterium]
GLEFIRNEPVKWLKLLLKKFFLFWNAYEYPININYYAAREMIPFFRLPSHQILVRGLPLVGFGLISPLALFGLFLARRKNGQVKLLFFYIFSVLFTNLFFFVASEYRFPAVPILLIFTAYTIYWWFEKIKKREYRSFFISLFTVMILGIGANWKVPPAANTLHYSLGNAYSEKGDYLKAREEYHQALRRAPDFVEVYINLANVYLDLGEFELAEKCLQRAQMLKPDDVGIYNNLGLLNLKQGNYQEAEKFFKKTLEMNSNYGPGYCNLGEMYYTLRRDEEAIKFLEQGLEVDPYPQNYYWLLRIYKETDNDKKAKETFTLGLKKYEEEISRRPEEGDLYSEYALFLLESGLKEEVITSNVNRIFNFAEKGINLRRSPFAYYVLGRVYLLNSQIEQSLHYFTKSLALNPNDAETYLWLGKIYKYWLNESREATDSKAREYFTQGLRINPYYRFLKEEMNN